jgi:hypothetical protein
LKVSSLKLDFIIECLSPKPPPKQNEEAPFTSLKPQPKASSLECACCERAPGVISHQEFQATGL